MMDFCLHDQTPKPKKGRPENIEMSEAFEMFCHHFENMMYCESYTIQELHEKLLEFNENGYTLRRFRDKLSAKYEGHIYFVKGKGRQSDLVMFRNLADFHLRRLKSLMTKGGVLRAAAQIIKADIRDLDVSKWLVNHLSKLGLAITPDEVTRFKQSVIANLDADQLSQINLETLTQLFAQWIADNADHNTVTLSGKGTFHGMGIICTSDKPPQGYFGRVPGLKKRLKVERLTEKRGVEIVDYFKNQNTGLNQLLLKPYHELQFVSTIPSSINYDIIWHCGWFSHSKTRPNWNGYMQLATGTTPDPKSKSTVTFLPIIDLTPSSPKCIYSTLQFIINEAKKAGITTPSVTFDQPLWLKAMGIIKEESLSAWRFPHFNEFCGKYRDHDERLRSRTAIGRDVCRK
ncbi:uncharacterized protein [Clytia hemisphaerica]|uniref:uncharacterized protein n=1 Tax=Clytia hemisphaerica TaxID=252671 RepID=UPI0034D5979F